METIQYRTNGATGALLDEYERAIRDLKRMIANLQKTDLETVVDPETTDPDCRSIQTVLTHVVRSAFGYATYIRQKNGESIDFRLGKSCETAAEYCMELDAAFEFTAQTFEMFPDMELESFEAHKKIKVRWGQLYDVDQMMEHAIVHILRHRRQIERFLLKIRG